MNDGMNLGWMLFLAGLLASGQAVAQQMNASAGQKLVVDLCARCHRVGPDTRDPSHHPPDLAAVAGLRSTTELSLRIFLQTPHGEMPRYLFSDDELGALALYIVSLKQ